MDRVRAEAMKIAFVYDVIYPFVKGGVEKRIRELGGRLSARGHEVHVIGMQYWDGPASIETGGVILQGICPAQPLYQNGRRTICESLYFSTCLLPFMIREKYDIVDCQQFPYFPCFPAKLAAVIKKEPLIVTWHEVWGDYWYEYLGWKGALGKGIERLVSLLTPHTISVSGTTEQNLRLLGLSRPIPIIPNGIDIRHLKSVRPHEECCDLIFVGRLIQEKHADILVRAFASLRPEYPDLTLLILGDGPEKEVIRSLITDLSAGDRIFLKPFTDSHDEVIGRMKASHVCVIPSTREGFGIAALEALACGLPVITVNHPGNAIRELLSERTGFICPLSEQAIADAIRVALHRYPDMREDCMKSAEPFDWDHIADLLEDYYTAVISGS